MKPLYLLLIFYALFITGLGDALELAFTTIIPGVGIVIGMPLDVVINITMGSGLVLLLAQNGMFHPKFCPAGIVAGALPGIDSLPVWLALVIAGILQKMATEETGTTGMLARVASSASSFSLSSPLAVMRSAGAILQTIKAPPQAATNDNTETKQPRVPLNLTSPRINADIRHVQKAA
jgi:hypothetical protein